MGCEDVKPFSLRGMKSFYVGGESQRLELAQSEGVALAMGSARRPLDQTGDYQIGQMYVQGFLAGEPNGSVPLLMWHGGGMTGVTWETTPDGRPGWVELALRDGFDVYVSDAVERGRSSFPPTAVTEMAPVFRPKELSWQIFRMGPEGGYASGPAERRFFEGQRFPAAQFDVFCNQFVARWPELVPLVEKAYDLYLQQFESSIIMGHSQGCGFAQAAAAKQPGLVKAIVLVEPSGSPTGLSNAELEGLKDVPHLVIWGDFFEQSPVWQGYRQTVEAHLDALRAVGTPVTVVDLPAIGINGNSHFPMMDDNSADIWNLVSKWLNEV